MRDDNVPAAASLASATSVPVNEAAGYPKPAWGKGEEPHPKPHLPEKAEGSEDHPVTVSP